MRRRREHQYAHYQKEEDTIRQSKEALASVDGDGSALQANRQDIGYGSQAFLVFH